MSHEKPPAQAEIDEAQSMLEEGLKNCRSVVDRYRQKLRSKLDSVEARLDAVNSHDPDNED